jgi:hypothetical protein
LSEKLGFIGGAQMNEILERLARQGGIVSGGPVDAEFTRGWGKHPFRGELAHHWTADRTIAAGHKMTTEGAYWLHSACGMTTVATSQVPLLGAGTYEYCKRCERVLMKPNV